MVNGSHSGAKSAIRAIRDNRFDTRLLLRASVLISGCDVPKLPRPPIDLRLGCLAELECVR
jgi:hypothetical protein